MLSLQLIMLYGLVVIGIIYVTATSSLAITAQDTDRQTAPRERSRCPFIRNSLVNGRVKIRSRGRIAKFICNNGYELVGRRFATCVRSQWNNPIPICVTNGCPVINNPANGETNIQISDALVTFSCDAGYILRGSSTIYCNGADWNDTVPVCDITTTSPELTCDFEDPNICGWSHDRHHNFDWRRHQFSTPSGHAGTGPSYDHTLGRNNNGHYMYTEASPPRVLNDSARLFSPVYFPEATPSCFVFWYHMFGTTTGSLRVYLKKESQVFRELLPIWERTGPQGNLWLQGYLPIPELKENFQITIEGIRGTGYIGDTAIDDVALYSTPCENLVVANITRGADSCKHRCFTDEEVNTTCSCKPGCEDVTHLCCDDYEYFCTDSVNRTDVGLFSVKPSLEHLTTPGENSSLPVETFPAETVTSGSAFSAVINTSEVAASSSPNTSDQIIVTQSPSATATALTNEVFPVINSPTPNLPLPLTTVSSTTVVSTSASTEKPVLNTTTSSTTTIPTTSAIIKETTPKNPSVTSIPLAPSATTKVIPLPSAKTSSLTTPPQIVKSSTFSSKSHTVETSTTNSTSTRILPIKITGSTTSSTSRTSTWLTSQSTTSKRVIPPIVITPAPTTIAPLTTQITVSTPSSAYSTHSTSSLQDRKPSSTSFTQPSSTAPVPNKTTPSIINKPISTDRYSKSATTTKQSSKPTTFTTKSSTSVYYKRTEKTIEKASTVSTSKTARPLTTTISSSFKYPNQSHPLIPQNTTSSTAKFSSTASPTSNIVFPATSTPKKITTVHCPEGSLRFNNGRCFPPWTDNVQSSKAVTTSKTSSFLKPSTTLVTKTSNTALKVTEVSNTNVSRKRQTTKPTPSKSTTGFTHESTEMLTTWKPDFKSRTKYRTYIQKPSEKSPVSITMIVALTVGAISVLLLIIIVGLYIFCRKRKASQSKLSDDSEMRFLSDSEIVEFADASTKLHADSG